MNAVSPELIAIIGVAIALGGLILRMSTRLEGRIERLESGVTDLRERVARLEGAVDILTKFLIDREAGRKEIAT